MGSRGDNVDPPTRFPLRDAAKRLTSVLGEEVERDDEWIALHDARASNEEIRVLERRHDEERRRSRYDARRSAARAHYKAARAHYKAVRRPRAAPPLRRPARATARPRQRSTASRTHHAHAPPDRPRRAHADDPDSDRVAVWRGFVAASLRLHVHDLRRAGSRRAA